MKYIIESDEGIVLVKLEYNGNNPAIFLYNKEVSQQIGYIEDGELVIVPLIPDRAEKLGIITTTDHINVRFI